MSSPPLARRERLALCDRFEALGPDAPTLDEGWVTADLAAHLVTREANPAALPGLVVPGAPARLTERLTARTKSRRSYDQLIAALRSGPPLLPLGLPGLEDRMHLHEFFVHHEDVRRANGDGPRPPDPELDKGLWRLVRTAGPLLARRVRGGVLAVRPDGTTARLRRGEPVATLTGSPGELLLLLFGRSVAQVDVTGP
ncbi:MAG: TIGR03085 family protein, partial [Acidimicrobiia bacterium]|nr:TIGR03085 family protein [Acidimicrobiia bacterium]